MITQKYILNMIPGYGTMPPIVHASQTDNESRDLIFDLWAGDVAFTVPSGATVSCDGTKPDKKGFSVSCTYTGNTVTVTATKQMLAVAGEVECQLTVRKGETTLGSANFVIQVEKSSLMDDTDMSESEYEYLEALRTETVSASATAVSSATSAKSSAEIAKAYAKEVANALATANRFFIVDDITGEIYFLGIENGLLYYEEES